MGDVPGRSPFAAPRRPGRATRGSRQALTPTLPDRTASGHAGSETNPERERSSHERDDSAARCACKLVVPHKHVPSTTPATLNGVHVVPLGHGSSVESQSGTSPAAQLVPQCDPVKVDPRS